jgi:cell wall-associated NlpC family hydrolase
MKFKYITLLLLLTLTVGWQVNKVNLILSKSIHIEKPSDRIVYISEQFMGTPYKAGTMKGDPDKKEELVINLNEMDCFTFIDYVEAIRLSVSPDDFIRNLKNVRYFDGQVDYSKRRHFFTDWISGERNTVQDITSSLPGAVTVEKIINRKSDEKSWLKNVPQKMRMVHYVPGDKAGKKLIQMLQNGDYIGIYSDKQGLDVSHTGIFIRTKKGEFFRNTSSKVMKVTDYPIKDYLKSVKGIIVLRAK